MADSYDSTSVPTAETTFDFNAPPAHPPNTSNEPTTLDNYKDLLTRNRRFLRQESTECPHHLAPCILRETEPLVRKLLYLNDLGLYTISSQPFEHNPPYHAPILDDFDRPTDVHLWVERRQRPFIELLFPCTCFNNDFVTVSKFLSALLAHEKIFLSYVCHTNKEDVGGNLGQAYDDVLLADVPVTESRQCENREDLAEMAWQDVTGMAPMISLNPRFVREIAAFMPFDVHIVARNWEEKLDVLDIAIGAATTAGMRPTFKE